MAGDITVGLDIGTTSVKALAVDADGTVLARSRIPHEVFAPTPDIHEHNALEAWYEGPRRAVAELGVADFVGIGVASMVPSMTAVDDDGRPMTPGLLYGDHRGRTSDHAVDPLNSGEYRAMLDWTIQQAPNARGYWTAPAVAAAALGGTPVLDIGTGVALAPLWDGDWQADRLAEIGLRPEQMPVISMSNDSPSGWIGKAAQAPGMADAWAEATVAGATGVGDALVICGTTLIIWCALAEPMLVDGLWSFPHPYIQGLTMLAGASNAGGMFINWARRTLAGATVQLEPESLPVWVPYVRGERTPLHDPSRRASLHDAHIGQDSAALMRAAYEAAGFVVRRQLDQAGSQTRRIVASGGGVHDEEWMQALADCTGVPVDVVAVPEGAALGAAWYGRMAAGLEPLEGVARWVRHGRRYEPDPRWLPHCEERYQRWRTLAD